MNRNSYYRRDWPHYGEPYTHMERHPVARRRDWVETFCVAVFVSACVAVAVVMVATR